ncbi:hypothetical protein HDU93_002214 [Gonapodya sp. JEL0774]|nr:hypothetical protein HDU93_002214 [Gonapodya sp. JEL0774]
MPSTSQLDRVWGDDDTVPADIARREGASMDLEGHIQVDLEDELNEEDNMMAMEMERGGGEVDRDELDRETGNGDDESRPWENTGRKILGFGNAGKLREGSFSYQAHLDSHHVLLVAASSPRPLPSSPSSLEPSSAPSHQQASRRFRSSLFPPSSTVTDDDDDELLVFKGPQQLSVHLQSDPVFSQRPSQLSGYVSADPLAPPLLMDDPLHRALFRPAASARPPQTGAVPDAETVHSPAPRPQPRLSQIFPDSAAEAGEASSLRRRLFGDSGRTQEDSAPQHPARRGRLMDDEDDEDDLQPPLNLNSYLAPPPPVDDYNFDVAALTAIAERDDSDEEDDRWRQPDNPNNSAGRPLPHHPSTTTTAAAGVKRPATATTADALSSPPRVRRRLLYEDDDEPARPPTPQSPRTPAGTRPPTRHPAPPPPIRTLAGRSGARGNTTLSVAPPPQIQGLDLEMDMPLSPDPFDDPFTRPLTPPPARGTRSGGGQAGSFSNRPRPTVSCNQSRQQPPSASLPLHRWDVPPSGTFLRGITQSGARVYFGKKRSAHSNQTASGAPSALMAAGGLLEVPVYALQREIETERAMKARMLEDREVLGENSDRLDENGKGKKETKLWCDKYRPRKYHELGGLESINREVLAWVKNWDGCVFGKKKSSVKQATTGGGGWKREWHEDDGGVDELGRPEKKILLLCGPPGFGKTTLAHVVAKHCGYEVVEVNASDDRTASQVSARVQSALTHQSITGISPRAASGVQPRAPRPNLLVVDEIDGAATTGRGEADLVQMLVGIADGKGVQKGGGRNVKKAMAKVVIVRPPPLRMVAQRLARVCEEEGLDADTRTLTAVAEAWGGDMRGCLMGLQMARARSDKLTIEDLRKFGTGKDSERSLFGVWEDVFTVPSAKQKRADVSRASEADEGSFKASGARGKGIFENYPHMRITDISTDPADARLVQAADWLAFYDVAHGRLGIQADFELMRYAPFTVAAFHGLFAVVHKPKLQFPRMDYEAYVATKYFDELSQTFVFNMSLSVRRTWGGARGARAAALELVSPLLRVINPDLRPLLRPIERRSLTRVVRVMLDYGVTFVQEKLDQIELQRKGTSSATIVGSDGQYLYNLQPPLQQMISFTGGQLRGVLTTGYIVRQMIAQEVELERLRLMDKAKVGRGTDWGPGKENKPLTEEDNAMDDTSECNKKGGKTAVAKILNFGLTETELKDKILKKINAVKHTGSSSPADPKDKLDFFGRPLGVKDETHPLGDMQSNLGKSAGVGPKKVEGKKHLELSFYIVPGKHMEVIPFVYPGDHTCLLFGGRIGFSGHDAGVHIGRIPIFQHLLLPPTDQYPTFKNSSKNGPVEISKLIGVASKG